MLLKEKTMLPKMFQKKTFLMRKSTCLLCWVGGLAELQLLQLFDGSRKQPMILERNKCLCLLRVNSTIDTSQRTAC